MELDFTARLLDNNVNLPGGRLLVDSRRGGEDAILS